MNNFKNLLSLFLIGLTLDFQAQGQTVVLQIDSSSPLPAVLQPNDTFSLQLDLNNQSTLSADGYTVDLRSMDSTFTPVSGVFDLTGRTIDSVVIDTATTGLTLPITLSPQVTSGGSTADLGAYDSSSTPVGLGTGLHDVQTFTFKVDANAPVGSYYLEFYSLGSGNSILAPIVTDINGTSIGTATSPLITAIINIEAVPEPQMSTYGVFVLVFLLLVSPLIRHRSEKVTSPSL